MRSAQLVPVLIALLSWLVSAGVPAVAADERAAEQSARRTPLVNTIEHCSPATVSIFQWGTDLKTMVNGSGAIIHETGYVVTVAHVADYLLPNNLGFAVLYDGKRYPCRKIASFPQSEVAVVKIDLDSPAPVIQLGRSSELKVSEPVVALGNPGGWPCTVLAGAISRLNAPLNAAPGVFSPATGGGVIEFTPAASHGISGAPVFTMSDKLVGMVNATNMRNVTYAVPADLARTRISQLLSESSVGVTIGLAVDCMGEAKVTAVEPGSPADKAGLRVGDVLTGIGKFRISDGVHYYLALAERKPDERITIAFRRGGEAKTAELTVGPRPSVGLSVVKKDVEIARVLVMGLTPGSPAEKAGFQVNDVIVKANGQELPTRDDFIAIVQALKPGDELAVGVLRGGQPQQVKATLGKQPTANAPFLGLAVSTEKGKKESRIVVGSVAAGSSAEKAGIQADDVFATVNGKAIQTSADVIAALQRLKIGDELAIIVVRGGRTKEFKVKLDSRRQSLAETLPPPRPHALTPGRPPSELPFLGIAMADGPEKDQVLVDSTIADSPAEKAGFQHGDVIAAIDGRRIQTRADVADAVRVKSAGDTISVDILRAGQKQTVKVTLGKQP